MVSHFWLNHRRLWVVFRIHWCDYVAHSHIFEKRQINPSKPNLVDSDWQINCICVLTWCIHYTSFELCHEKTCLPHIRKQRRRWGAQLISFFVFAVQIAQSSTSYIRNLEPLTVFMLVQAGLCRILSESRRHIFSRRGSFVITCICWKGNVYLAETSKKKEKETFHACLKYVFSGCKFCFANFVVHINYEKYPLPSKGISWQKLSKIRSEDQFDIRKGQKLRMQFKRSF